MTRPVKRGPLFTYFHLLRYGLRDYLSKAPWLSVSREDPREDPPKRTILYTYRHGLMHTQIMQSSHLD